MKVRRIALSAALLVGAVSLWCFPSPAQAVITTYIWDPLGNLSTTDSSGTWDTSSLVWDNSGTDYAWLNTSGGSAVAQFGNGNPGTPPYTVTLSQATTANGIIFQDPGYTLSGSTLALSSGTSSIPTTITMNASSGTIASTISSPKYGMTLTGTGTLTLDGTGTSTMAYAIGGGTVGLNINEGNLVVAGGSININGNSTRNIGLQLGAINNGAASTYTQTGGTVTIGASSNVFLGFTNGSGPSTFNLSGGSFSVLSGSTSVMYVGYGSTSAATLNLTGGTLSVEGLYAGGYTTATIGTINLSQTGSLQFAAQRHCSPRRHYLWCGRRHEHLWGDCNDEPLRFL